MSTHLQSYFQAAAIAACLACAMVWAPDGAVASPQAERTSSLVVTPSATILVVEDAMSFSAIGENGRPLTNVEWSFTSPIAEIEQANGEVLVIAKEPGQALLTAKADNQTASALVSVVTAEAGGTGTVHWSLQPTPGFETLLVQQAFRAAGAPAFYSIEWRKSANAVVRALKETGQQMWMRELASIASPATLKQEVPEPEQMFENDVLLSNRAMFVIGDKGAVAVNNATDPSAYGLPADGKTILLGAEGDNSGGMVLLERGRFRDSLVDINPADGSELWRYHSEGRLAKTWTVNFSDVGIVEALDKPASSALLVLNARTGEVRFRIPFPVSSSTIDGFRCTDPQRNVLKSVRASSAGSVFTAVDNNMYLQVATHVESSLIEACENKSYSFDDSLALLRVTPRGETTWKPFQHIHAEGEGAMVVQPRVFAGNTIPDGFGGVLAAWTYVSPKVGSFSSEARLSRISESTQRDFVLPMPWWTRGITGLFEGMVLGDGNILYATNGPQLVRFDTQAGEVNWLKHPPTGEIKIDHATAGGGLLVSNAGRLIYFDPKGNQTVIVWTVAVTNPNDIGFMQQGLVEREPRDPLQLRELNFGWGGDFIAVEDGAPYGKGALLYIMGH